MPSPNGYFDCGASSVQDRQRFQSEVVYDADAAPWPGSGDPSLGGYHWIVNIGTAPAGPFTAAPLADFGTGCTPEPDNEVNLGGITSTIVSIADSTPGTGLQAGTDYYVEWILLDDLNVERDRFVCGPIQTEAYPTFAVLNTGQTQTTGDVFLGGLTGFVNQGPPCNQDTVVWEISTTPGGPYTATAPVPATGSPDHTFTGLTPGTTYYWRAQISEQAQSGGVYYTSPESSFTTLALDFSPACSVPGPVTSSQAPVSGTADGVPADHTILLALGTVSGGPYPTTSPATAGDTTTGQTVNHTFTGLTPSTTYYFRTEVRDPGDTVVDISEECSFTTAAGPQPPEVPPFQPLPCGSGDGGDSADVEGTLVCDVDAEGNVIGVALVEAVYDDTGTRTGTRLVSVTDGTEYVPQGTVQPCQEGCCPEPVVLCDVQEDGSAVQFLRTYTGQADGGVLATDQLLDGSVYAPTGTVGSCDPYSSCTPSNDQDLNAECGPGESPDQGVIAEDPAHPLANAVFVDDSSADPLCGGSWDRPASALSAPFPVNESFRNTTFDQPGPVLQGTAPYPDLTADVDGAGAGWLQVSDINSGTNGLWQVPSPFPTSQGMNAAITWASHDGTTPGGDGMAFVFTDGSVAPQGIPVGGFGNLGLQNWQGGYVAVVVDEYGQTCTCSHAAQGTIDPNPGPCGFCTNTISIQLAGTARQSASCACCTVASMPLAPKALNQTTRFSPARILVSIIEEGGQTFVSASIDWNDGNGPVQYFDRVNVTACAGPPPATLRMASYGGSGGSYRAIKEFRDATARPAGVSNWRAFPFTTDAIPECTTLVNVRACIDVTFNSDTQTAGNSDPEAYLLLVDTQTNTVLDRAVQSSIPAQVGTPHNLCVEEAVPPEKVPFLRVYVGAESRDQNGEYDQLWENLEITAVGTGCAAQPRRTLEISARCPVPVTIVGGSADGGGGGTTVVNTPATFEDAPVCMTIGGETVPGFRREVRSPDGTIDVSFLGVDGLPVTPESWTAGGCSARDTEIVELCDLQLSGVAIPYLRVFTYDENGEVIGVENQDADGNPYMPTGTTTICDLVTITEEVLCDEGNGGQPFLRSYVRAGGILVSVQDQELDAVTPYVPVGPVGACGGSAGSVAEFVLCDVNAGVATPFIRKLIQDADGAVTATVNLTLAGAPYTPTGTVGVCSPTGGRDEEILVLCDSASPTPNRFLRRYNYDAATGALIGIVNTTLDGSTAFAPVGAVGVCAQTVQSDTDFVEEVLCDGNGTAFIRLFRFNSATGTLISTTNTTLAGAAFSPVGTVGICSDCCPTVIGEGCTNTGSGFYTAIRSPSGSITLIDSVSGAAVTAANIVTCPSDDVVKTLTAQARTLTNATPWTPGGDVTGTLTSLTVTGTSGLWDLVDANGTALTGLPAGLSLTWNADDDNTLTGPTSVTPQPGSTVVAHWTQR
ncbi:hypothetical protein [Streptomyces sp. NPDC059063]|uniref:hypothetical protein n=1 Tax=Streptomyces sp. NPDC059063 TaxID=3346712 RepID=UPI0036B48018